MSTIEALAFQARPNANEANVASPSAEPLALNAAVYILFCVLSVIPFALVAQPPIVDFANHAARLDMACSMADPAVAAMYRYHLGIIPNLAIDLVNVPLCGLMGPSAVLRSVVIVALMAIYGASWFIQRRLFERSNAFLLLMPAISFNLVTTMGYINFLAGIGILMIMIALAIRHDQKLRSLLAIGNIGGAILFFCHIFALIIGLIFFFGWFLRGRPFEVRRVVTASVKTAAMFALPLLLIPFVAESGAELAVSYDGKIRMLFALFMAQHSQTDIYGVLLLMPLWLAFRFGPTTIHPSFRLPLLLVTLYVLIVPNQLMDAVDIDARSFVALAYLMLAAVSPLVRDKRVSSGLMAGAAALIALHLYIAATSWVQFSRNVDEFRNATAILPEHAKVLSSMGDGTRSPPADRLTYSHLVSYATIDRRIFNPLEFTGVGMQPLSSVAPYAAFDVSAALPYSGNLMLRLKNPDRALEKKAIKYHADFAVRWPQHFDYIIYYHFGGKPNFDPDALNLIRNGSFFSILAVKPNSAIPLH